MEWLTRNLTALFEWLWDNILDLGHWLGDRIVGGINYLLRQCQAVAVVLLATVAGVAPGESLAETWANVLQSLDWLQGWPLYVLQNCLAFDFALARLTYFAAIVLAAYTLRIAFSAARAALDLL